MTDPEVYAATILLAEWLGYDEKNVRRYHYSASFHNDVTALARLWPQMLRDLEPADREALARMVPKWIEGLAADADRLDAELHREVERRMNEPLSEVVRRIRGKS